MMSDPSVQLEVARIKGSGNLPIVSAGYFSPCQWLTSAMAEYVCDGDSFVRAAGAADSGPTYRPSNNTRM